eukprot:TRINITY_DN16537_c1_g1_i1.p1 TRINITY_DN16537_c1_g1~~TRINITY_DN16537_c1_g1_i1.p1  ORF type:complete len:452 (-),score=35.77 TRINITY_DN16537_c1_g1_i1:78-1349(-)
MSRLTSFSFFMIQVVIVQANQFDIRKHFGTKTRYDFRQKLNSVLLQKSKDAVGCVPQYVYGVIRHGTRYPTLKRLEEMKLNTQYLKVELGDDWSYPFENFRHMAGELHSIGEEEMYQLGARLGARFPQIFSHPYSSKTFKIQSSQKTRASTSAMAFSMGLWPNRTNTSLNQAITFPQPVAITMNPKRDDPLLRFFDLCPKYWKTKADTEKNANAWMKRYYQQIHQNISDVSEGDDQQLMRLWSQCVHEGSALGITDGACSLFREEHVKILAWLDDLVLWQTKGPAQLVNIGMARPLVEDLIQVLKEYESGQIKVEKSRLYFAHGETIIPFEVLIGVIGKDESGSWNGNFVSPYGANLFVVIYDCGEKGGTRIQLYQNEERIGCKGGIGGSCLLQEFIQQLQSGLDEYEEFDKLCEIENRECKA